MFLLRVLYSDIRALCKERHVTEPVVHVRGKYRSVVSLLAYNVPFRHTAMGFPL